jgi:hypothetical protein
LLLLPHLAAIIPTGLGTEDELHFIGRRDMLCTQMRPGPTWDRIIKVTGPTARSLLTKLPSNWRKQRSWHSRSALLMHVLHRQDCHQAPQAIPQNIYNLRELDRLTPVLGNASDFSQRLPAPKRAATALFSSVSQAFSLHHDHCASTHPAFS